MQLIVNEDKTKKSKRFLILENICCSSLETTSQLIINNLKYWVVWGSPPYINLTCQKMFTLQYFNIFNISCTLNILRHLTIIGSAKSCLFEFVEQFNNIVGSSINETINGPLITHVQDNQFATNEVWIIDYSVKLVQLQSVGSGFSFENYWCIINFIL